jgi:DNA gyrase subunit A
LADVGPNKFDFSKGKNCHFAQRYRSFTLEQKRLLTYCWRMESTAASINPITIESEMRQSYLDYAMSVIVGRALPDVRDGLKPVQRRVLYAMLSEGLTSGRKHSKCAGVVGEVLKRFHPHGDMPVYEALVRLAQPWNLRYPLIDGQGNFGSIDGDPPAAYRYTECRMTALAESLLEDIEKETVTFSPNFDDSTVEPDVLPAVIPNLLVNGATGIAVGMAAHLPPHNLGEVISGALAVIDDPNISLPKLLELIPGPDFPTGGTIYGRGPIISAYSTGRGIIQIRAKATVETIKGKTREVEAIVITEIPYQLNKSRLIEKIAELVNDKQIDGISKLRDESDRTGMRIVIEVKKDATPEVVLNQLYKLTPLQSSFGIINLAIVHGRPMVCSLLELLTHFLNHRRDVINRRTEFDLRKAKERMHILDGFKIALLNLDEVIKLIRGSNTPKEAKDGLIDRFSLSPIQAQAILDLRLQKLTGMERLAIEQEHAELAKLIEELLGILADPRKVDDIIKAELLEIKEKFADPRRTEIVDDNGAIDMTDLIEDEEMVVTVSHKGYVKRTSVSEYREQKRGGKGIIGAAADDEDFIEHLFVSSTLADLLIFTNQGRMYWLKVYNIPESGRTTRGRALVNLIEMKEDEKLCAILPVREINQEHFVVMATERGVIKKTGLEEFCRSRRNGIMACTLDEGDIMIGAAITNGKEDILLATRDGMAIRFMEDQVRAMGRAARGVTGIRFEGDDKVVGMTIVSSHQPENADEAQPSEELTLLTVCENGFGKRTLVSEYRSQNRGGKGLIDIQTDGRNGPVVQTLAVTNSTGLMLITSGGKIIRTGADNVSVIGRNTRGVKLIDLDEGEKVVAVAPAPRDDSSSEEAPASPETTATPEKPE